MHIDHRNPRVRRGFAFVALAAVLGLAAVGITQCRMVNDNVTGVDLRAGAGTLSHRSSCARRCNDQFKACIRAEEARYKAAKRACGHDFTCKKNEQRKHRDNIKACENAKRQCKKSCYNEGAGNSGA
jgi:hypothetical protein